MSSTNIRFSEYDSIARLYHEDWVKQFKETVLPPLESLLLRHLSKEAHILDLCCGNGQLAQYLLRKGYRVTGLDGSEVMLHYARENAPRGEFILDDARFFNLPSTFHGVVSTTGSLNYIMSFEELTVVFHNVYKALLDNGIFVFNLFLEDEYQSDWNGRIHGNIKDDYAWAVRQSYHPEEKIGYLNFTIFQLVENNWQRLDTAILEKCYSVLEVQSALESVGFMDVKTYDAKDDFSVHNNTGSAYFVCRKELFNKESDFQKDTSGIELKKINSAVPVSAQTLHQQKHLEDFIACYTQRTKTSKQLAQTYRPVLADNKNLGEFSFQFKELYYPIVGRRSLGSRIWDVDDNEYVDVMMGLGINLFGHNPLFIKDALVEQLNKGIQIGPQSELAGEVAELISELTQMERVAFSNTGTEAVMTAIRLARAVTGRTKIALFSGSYHGHFDGTLVKAQTVDGNLHVVPLAPGIPPNIVNDVLVLDYGSPQSFDVIKEYERELAAVLVVPVQTARPGLQPRNFLHQLRQLTQELGIILIFDEMVTGFRIHPGGAQAYFGVEADIATYGKIVGGGMPIGIIAGKAVCMDAIDGGMWSYGDSSYPQAQKIFFAGTFCKHPLAMAAARAVLKHLKTQGSALQEQLNQRTSQFVAALNTYFKATKVPLQFANFGSLFGPASIEDPTSAENSVASESMDLLRYQLLSRGVHLLGASGYLSTAHSDEDLDYIIQAIKDSVAELCEGGFLPAPPAIPKSNFG